MSKFNVGDRVRDTTGVKLEVRGADDDIYWCYSSESNRYETYTEGDLARAPIDPAEVLAKLERLMAAGVHVDLSHGNYIVGGKKPLIRDTLTEAIMAAEEP
jgi:hypothetical protein